MTALTQLSNNSKNTSDNSSFETESVTARKFRDYINSLKNKEALKSPVFQFIKIKLKNSIVFIIEKIVGISLFFSNSIKRLKRKKHLTIGLTVHKNLYKIVADQKWSDIAKYIDRNRIEVAEGLCHGFSSLLGVILLNESDNKNPTGLTYKDFLFCLDILSGNQKYEPDKLREEDKVKLKTFIEKVLIYQNPETLLECRNQDIVDSSEKLKEKVHSVSYKYFKCTKEEFVRTFPKYLDNEIKNASFSFYLDIRLQIYSWMNSPHACSIGFLDGKALFYNYDQAYCDYTGNEKLSFIKEFKLSSTTEMERMAETIFDTCASDGILSSKKVISFYGHSKVDDDTFHARR